MDEKSLRALEIQKIREMLARECVTEPGREQARTLAVSTEEEEVRAMLNQTGEAFSFLTRHGASPIRGFPDIRPVLARIRLDAVLSMRELLDMAAFLRAVQTARRLLCEGETEETTLSASASLLTPLRDTEEAITRAILSDTEMADDASPQLASLRRQIRRQSEAVKEKLTALMRGLEKQGVLQEAVITMRFDRYVLPVVAAHKKSVPGIVHDQSATGATLFIEPMAVVEIHNDIRRLQLEEQEEIQRILADFSHRLYTAAAQAESSSQLMTQLDIVFAKARLARLYDGVCPGINSKGVLDIRAGRHPLLTQHTVVPITVWVGETFTVLLITGPNTGGKTVTLKTIGLFALMTQTGLFLPAEEGTQMPVFDGIFADIGDEQSIEQNLSTFSSHMKQIASIMREVTPRSLVLLDELGAGTDPAEGAALAMSILEELRRKRIRTVVTSHYAELKAYSLSHAGAENASMEFDAVSLRPTYRLLVGVPGNSNAFLISAKLGLERSLIDRARSYVDEDARKLDKVLAGAEEYRVSAQAQRTEAEQLRRTLEKEKRELEKERKALEQEKEQAVKKAKREAEKIREQALAEANDTIEKLKKLSE
ncbi:MAG: endonuclease MutS2, partial [Clostridia bacterium]|nr:endonuclease MutS2 [Clostridia bacterium]